MTARSAPWFALSLLAACAAELDPAAVSSEPAEATGTGAGLAAAPTLHVAYTEYLGQLTGRSPNPYPVAMRGTDLGVSFQRDNKLHFLFGDTWTNGMVLDGEFNRDTVASAGTTLTLGQMPRLSWYTRSGNRWAPLSIAGVSNNELKEMSVPVEGIPVGTLNYVFYHSDFDTNTATARKSILAHAVGDTFASPLVLDHIETNSKKFLSVSAVMEAGQIYIFGAGQYRKSSVYLAKVAAADLPFRTRWTYYAGSAGWVSDEAQAQPVMNDACVGELSVRKHSSLGYLMAYNCASGENDPQNRVLLRTASSVLGPWSQALPLFTRGEAAGRFMHVEQPGADDGLRESYQSFETWTGNIYGPYLVPAWFDEPGPGLHGIVYTLSTFIPYHVHLLRTVLAEPGYEAEAPVRGAPAAPKALQNADFAAGSLNGWTAEGEAFYVFQDGLNANKWTVSTYTQGRRSALRGKLWQEFTIGPDDTTLTFQVHGGRSASVTLSEGTDVLRRTTGRNTNDGRIEVSWNLELLRGKRVRLQIEDNATDTWGFIGTSGFKLD